MKTVLDAIPFTPIVRFLFHDTRRVHIGNRKLRVRVLWYSLPKACYVMRVDMWLEAFTLPDSVCK